MAANSPSLTGSAVTSSTHHILPAGTLRGTRVHNFAGEELGKVDEFVLDFDSGRISFVVVSVGGFLGIGDKLFPVPWELFTMRTGEHEFFLDVDKQMLLD